MTIPFNRPTPFGSELEYIKQAIESTHLSGDGFFTKKCHAWIEEHVGCKKALLTHSCTAALEMAAILANIGVGDEVIMPSYTFVSTANAFVLRGGIPVFVDIRPDTLNIDENKIETCITEKTKAIVVVHYAGVVCEMDSILAIAKKYDLIVIEDAAQAIYSKYKGKPAGSFGHMAAFSFHETKNLISGEGGALVLNDSSLIERAEIIREKGTNRSKFFRGQVDKYTWVDLGSSYLPGEITAAFLFAQLENAKAITEKRLQVWNSYHKSFEELETKGITKRPVIPQNCEHNAHMYYFIFPSLDLRQNFINQMKSEGIHCVFHYIPLHSSPAGKQFGRTGSPMTNTDRISNTLARLPIFCDLLASESSLIINKTIHFLEG